MFRRERSYPPETRERARELRQNGLTHTEIITELGGNIPHPTVQGWVKDIQLTIEQRARIKQKEIEAARQSQPLGAQWNHEQKERRLQEVRERALPVAKRLAQDRDALMLMAAALYVGEGGKRDDHLAFANSDPTVIRAWMLLLRQNFDIDESRLACQLMLSSGMPDEELKKFWSNVAGIPLHRFHKSSIKRTPGQIRREGYKGVCLVRYYSAEIRRYLKALAQGVIDELLANE